MSASSGTGRDAPAVVPVSPGLDPESVRLAEDAARQQEATASPDEAAPVDGARVRTQLGTLSPDLAAVLELAYFDGLSSSEIARRLQIPIGTVKSRMARALESLRQALLGPGGHT